MVGKGTDNPKFDAALRAKLDAQMHELGLNTTPWGQVPAADKPHETVITQDHINGIIGEVMAVCMNAGVTSDVMQRIVNGLNGKIGAPIQQLAECHQKAITHATHAAGEARAAANETPEQKTARLWGEIGQLNKEIDDDLKKLQRAGYIDEATMEQLRKERERIDAMEQGEARAKAEKAYQQNVQRITEGVVQEARRRGDTHAETTVTHVTKKSKAAEELAVELHDQDRAQNKTAAFASHPPAKHTITPTSMSLTGQSIPVMSATPIAQNAIAEPNEASNAQVEAKPVTRKAARRVVITSEETSTDKVAEAANTREAPVLPSTVVAGLSTVSNSTETGDTKLPPDARPKTPDGITHT